MFYDTSNKNVVYYRGCGCCSAEIRIEDVQSMFLHLIGAKDELEEILSEMNMSYEDIPPLEEGCRLCLGQWDCKYCGYKR